jgi:O-antigen/teichoic acid export membrane protein
MRFGGWLTVSSIVAPIIVSLDRFILGSVLGLVAVAHYAAPNEIVNRLLVVPASLAGALFPAWSTLQGRGDSERFERLAARACRFLLVLLGPGLVAIAALAPDLMRVWLGAEWAGDSGTALAILAVGVLANALAQIPYAVLHAVGRPDRTAIFHLIELPVHALVLWLLVRAWGVPGAALAWTLRAGLDAALLFGAAQRLAPMHGRTLRAEGVPRAVLLVALLGALALAAAAITSGPWRWIAVLALASAGKWFGWRRVLHPADRELVLSGLLRGARA